MEQEGTYYEMFIFTELMYIKNLILIVSKWGSILFVKMIYI